MLLSLSFLFNLVDFLTNHKIQKNYIFNKPASINIKYIEKLNLTQLPFDQYYDLKYGKNNSILQNYYFYNDIFKEVRLTYFISDDKELFSSTWYPSYNYDIPILNIELVKFTQNISLCFVNLIEIYNRTEYYNNYVEPFIKIKNNYPELSVNTTKHLLPFKNFLSKAILYGNIYNFTIIDNSVSKALDQYLDTYTNIFVNRPVIKYNVQKVHKEYNKIKKPIDKNYIIKDYFDKEWYELLIDNYYS
jgi:hypothetical protein